MTQNYFTSEKSEQIKKKIYVKLDVIKEVKLFSQSEWIFGFLHCGTNFPPKKLESN